MTALKFEPGAPAAEGGIPLCVPEIRGNEWAYIKECLDTNFVSSVGPFVDRFERELSEYVGTKYSVATSTGTAALHVALLVADIGPEDEVLVSALTFIAPVNAIRYVGAWPVFIDAEPAYWEMDPQKVCDFLEKDCSWEKGELRNRHTGRRVRAVMPVHILGHPVNMDPILEIARKYDLLVIEDATESLGATYKGNMTGRLGDIACFSFNGNKIITTGGGGMIVSNVPELAASARYLTTQAKDDEVRYVHNDVGYNFRLTNVQAAMGVAQMERLPEFVDIKRRNFLYYQEKIASIEGLTLAQGPLYARNNHWMYALQIDAKRYGKNRDELMAHLAEKGIQTRPVWHLNHLQKPYRNCQAFIIERAPKLLASTLNIPCSVSLTQEQLDQVIGSLRNA